MQTYSIEILNPKAIKLLEDLADLKLITFRNSKKKIVEPNNLQKLLLRAPTWTDEAYEEYLQNRQDLNKIGNAFTS